MTATQRNRERSPGGAVITANHVRAARLGHGANCSSIGSVIDTLFLTALAGGAIFAAIVAALGQEPIRVANPPPGNERGGAPKNGKETKT